MVIPTVPGCHTWGQSLAQARRNIREALATCADQFDDPDQVAASAVFEERLELSAEVKAAMKGYQRARFDDCFGST